MNPSSEAIALGFSRRRRQDCPCMNERRTDALKRRGNKDDKEGRKGWGFEGGGRVVVEAELLAVALRESINSGNNHLCSLHAQRSPHRTTVTQLGSQPCGRGRPSLSLLHTLLKPTQAVDVLIPQILLSGGAYTSFSSRAIFLPSVL